MNLESGLIWPTRALALQRLVRSAMGVKELARPTYFVHQTHRRFNQKFTTAERKAWDAFGQSLSHNIQKNKKITARKRLPGYTLIDRALADAAQTIPESFDMDVIRPNSGFLSWSPLKEPTHEALGMRIRDFDKDTMTQSIKKIAIWFGASLVGITFLERRWVYSHWYDKWSSPNRNPQIVFSDEPGFEKHKTPTQLEDGTQIIPKDMIYVISLGFEMDYDSMRTAPTAIAQAGTYMYGYRTVIQTVASLAEFIRGLGFTAIPSANDTALSIPLAINAGLGEDARYGGIITPEFGPRLRLAKIITNMPLSVDRPVTFGIHDFCEQCKKCARNCPVRAIPFGPRTTGLVKNDVDAPTVSENIGALRWVKNGERCATYFSLLGTNCGICIRVCPWNKPRNAVHSFPKYLAINGGSLIRRTLVELDNILGYGKSMNPDEWWGL